MNDCARCGEANPERARFCLTCGSALVRAPAPDERKLATVLFADLVGSTAMASDEDPERARARLERFYDAMAAEIGRAGGTVEKFVGDAVMAAFGAPDALEDHCERALHAALAMQRRLAELFGDGLALRIGVNTGEVVVGRAREGSSFVTGDPVNVAARLEQAASPGEILVGERTVRAVRGAFEFAEPTTIEAKGTTGGVACRALVRPLSLMRPRGVGGLRPAFVGREAETTALRGAYEDVATQREPRLATVVGDAGVGKTTLVRELWQWLGGLAPEPVRAVGRCLPYGRGITYWPLAEIVKEHFGILDSDPPETVLERLGKHRFLGLTLGLDVAGDLHPLAARDRLHDAWVDFLGELVAERPAVVLVEDLHWADENLFDVLDTVLRQVTGPLLVVATARPELVERRPGFGARRLATQLWLEPLGGEQAETILDTLLGGQVPHAIRDVVVDRAEGNPFFLEELLATLIDQGVLQRSNGGWSIGELPEAFGVPDTVQAVVAARVDLLGPAEKAALQAASVMGRVFWTAPLYELLGGVRPDLAVLEERDFIRRRHGSLMVEDREYAIKHALTREVAYESVPKAKRARLHAAFADWLERASAGRDELAPLLAHHYAEAVRPEHADLVWPGEPHEVVRLRANARRWLRRAAELAMSRYEVDEALALYARALELADDEDEQATLWAELGRVHALRFDGEAFWTAMQEAIRRSSDQGVLSELYALLSFETSARAGMWKQRPARELVSGWIGKALDLAEPGSRARAQALVARAFWEPVHADEAAREASEIAAVLDDVELRSYLWSARASIAFRARAYDDARAFTDRRFELAERITNPDHLADICQDAIQIAVAQGRFGDARRLGSEQARLAARLTPHHRVHAVSFGRLDVEARAGDWDAIRAIAREAERTVDANLDTPCVLNARSLLWCAVAGAHAGNDAEARRLEERVNEFGPEGYGPILDEPRLRLALVRRDRDTAARLVAPLAGDEGVVWNLATAARLDALVWLGERYRVEEEAVPLLRPGTYLEPFALRALGLARGDGGLVGRAAARFEELGLPRLAAETRSGAPAER